MKYISITLILLVFYTIAHCADVDSVTIMAHKMAPRRVGFAENSLSTLRFNMSIAPRAIQEIDVRLTKDSVLILLHDNTLDRTTTGSGSVEDWDYQQLQALRLKDAKGNILGDNIPLLREVLEIIKRSNAQAMLDVKSGVLQTMLMVESMQMTGNVIVICYNIEDAKMLNSTYPTLRLALGFNSIEGIDKIRESGLPFKNLVALVPDKIKPQSYYDSIMSMGIPISFSAQGGIDTTHDASLRYKELQTMGVNIICTDSLTNILRTFLK